MQTDTSTPAWAHELRDLAERFVAGPGGHERGLDFDDALDAMRELLERIGRGAA